MRLDWSEPEVLLAEAERAGLGLGRREADGLFAYLELLYTWNRRLGLTTVAPEAAARLHLFDSLTVLPIVRRASRVCDLGSGAGLPGIPLAVSCPEIAFTLVESARKKTSFLRAAVRALDLRNVTVLCEDAYALAEDPDMRFDVVVGRAFRQPAEFVRMASRLVTEDGRLLIMGGRLPDEELGKALRMAPHLKVRSDEQLNLPDGGEQRRLVVLVR